MRIAAYRQYLIPGRGIIFNIYVAPDESFHGIVCIGMRCYDTVQFVFDIMFIACAVPSAGMVMAVGDTLSVAVTPVC